MTVKASDLQLRFTADTAHAEAGIDRMSEKLRGLGGVMQTALGTAGGFVLSDLSPDDVQSLSAQINALADSSAQQPKVLAQGLYDIWKEKQG